MKRFEEAYKISELIQKKKSIYPKLKPINISPDDKNSLERALNSRHQDRYLKRLKDTTIRKYSSYWDEYHVGMGRPVNSLNKNHS